MSQNTSMFPCSSKEYCKKQKYDRLDHILIPPFETGNDELSKLLSFFLHKAPDISSIHSRRIDNQNNVHDLILVQMLDGRSFKQGIDFCASNCKIEKRLTRIGLSGDKVCLKCKRGVCKKNPVKDNHEESDLDCLLRHLRNSIAHGRFYYNHAGNRIYLMFEDVNPSGNLSARLICLRADLEHWKEILVQYK